MPKKGFSIIELLVVIAIISVLASIVIVNIGDIGVKAKDAAIKQATRSFFLLAQEYYESHGNYAGFCNYDSVEDLFDSLSSPKKFKYCHHDSDQWAVCAQLNFPEDLTKAWCIDSLGVIKQINQSDCEASITVCP